MKHSIAYLISVVLINIGFAHVPLVHGWPPMSLAVGLVFVLRDFSQREIGHNIVLLMLVGAALSYVMASPAVAVASCAAYMVGEIVDWMIFTLSRRTLHERVMLSSLISTPIDSAVFLAMIGILSLNGVLLMTASKMIGAVIAFFILRHKQRLENVV